MQTAACFLARFAVARSTVERHVHSFLALPVLEDAIINAVQHPTHRTIAMKAVQLVMID